MKQNPAPARIGIIGGGFGGAIAAVHLARAAAAPIHIEVIEPRPLPGAGLAYGSCRSEHRINVPSDRMVVFREEPLHFSHWLARTGERERDPEGQTPEGDHYSRRDVFARYMADLFAETARSTLGCTLVHRRRRAVGLARSGAGWEMTFDDGAKAAYDHVILSVAHAAPGLRWPIEDAARLLPHLVADPWDWESIEKIPDTAAVFIAGSGLAMCDAVTTLRRKGHRGSIAVISRRGLRPRPQGSFDDDPALGWKNRAPHTASALLRDLRAQIRKAERAGADWQSVLNAVREQLPLFWTRLPVGERARIVRHLKPYWDVHRFRAAPQVIDLIERGRREGWLTMGAGRIHRIGATGGRFSLEVTRRGERSHLMADAIVNCTGPATELKNAENGLLRAAMEAGFMRPDALALGIDVDPDGRVLGRTGDVTPGLWCGGPLARAHTGDTTGVPEVSDQARRIAEAVARNIAPCSLPGRTISCAT